MLNRLIAGCCMAVAALSAQAAPSRDVVLDVRGMTCATCPITVRTVLKKQPGVEDVKVDLKKQVAEVRFDAGRISPERLAEIVSEAGYPATARK